MAIHTSESTKALAPALAAVQAKMRAAGKSGENTFDHYKYAKLEDYLSAARPLLAENKLSVVVSCDKAERLPDRQTSKGGTERAVSVELVARIVHESGEWLEVVGYGEGQDRADKALYKAITGGKKYILAGLLAIPTTDEPEADETVGHAPPPERRTVKAAAAPPAKTNKERYEAAVAWLDKAWGKERADAIVAEAKNRQNGAKTAAEKLAVLEELEAAALDAMGEVGGSK